MNHSNRIVCMFIELLNYVTSGLVFGFICLGLTYVASLLGGVLQVIPYWFIFVNVLSLNDVVLW